MPVGHLRSTIIGDALAAGDRRLRASRLRLASHTAGVLRTGLDLLAIGAPARL